MDVIHAVQMDIEMYNYVDIVLRKNGMGTLTDEMRRKQSKLKEGEEHKDAPSADV